MSAVGAFNRRLDRLIDRTSEDRDRYVDMTALLAAIWVFELAGIPLLERPTGAWWAQRPLWLAVPGVFLVLLTAAFNRFERARGTCCTNGII